MIFHNSSKSLPQGSKSERAVSAVEAIGPAVLNGGVTTFLALVLLGLSTSHVFISFFKVYLSIDKYFQSVSHHWIVQVFSLTVIFGLYHGLVLLPVLLTILGPDRPEEAEDKLQSSNNNYGTRGRDNLVFVQEVNFVESKYKLTKNVIQDGGKNHVWT